MAFTIYLLAFAVSLVISSPYHFVLGTSNGINGTSTYNFGYDTRDHPGGSGSGVIDNGPRLMREETRLPDGTVIGRYGYTDPFGVFRQVKYVAGSTGYYAYEDVTGGSGGSTSLPLFFKATARQRDLGLSAGIDLSAKFNPPLYHPEAHLAEAETPSTPSPSTLSPWEGSFGASIPFKKILSPSSKSKEEPTFSRLHHHHQPSLYHRDYPSSSNNQLSTSSSTSSSSESTPFTLSSSSSKQSRLTHSLSPQSSHNQGRNNERLTLNRDKGLFTTLSTSSSTSSSGSVVKVTDGQSRYTRPPKTAFQFDFDQASLIKKNIPDQKSDIYGSYKELNLTPIKSNSNDEDDLKELESFRIPSGLNIHPSSLSRRRSSSSISSSRSSQLSKFSPSQPQSSSTPPPPPPPPPPSKATTVKTPSTYPSTVTTTSSTTETLINHPIFIRNQVNSEHSNENETVSFDENDRLRRSENLSSSDNNLKNDTYLPTISISREPVLEESSEDDLGETESVRVTSSSSSSSSSSGGGGDSNIGNIYNLYSREIKSTSSSSLAPLPINLSDISRYREATIPEVEILSTYGTRLNNPIDGSLESLGYYDSKLLRGLNYDDFGLEPQPVYTPVIDTSSSTSVTTKSSILEYSEDQNRTNEKTFGDDSSLNLSSPFTESVSVAISSTLSSGNETKDNEKLNENPIELTSNLQDQSFISTIKPEITKSMPTTTVSETITETVKPEEPVTFNQADNSYSLLTDQTLKVTDGNVKVTSNLTHKQVVNNRLITGSTSKSQSVTLSLQTEGTTFSSTSTLPSTIIDKSTVSRLTEVTTEIKALPEIITDEPTTLSPSTLPTTILSSSSSPTTVESSTILMRSSGFDDATTIKPDLGLVGDEVTTPMASVTNSNENNQSTTLSTSKATIVDSSTTVAENPSTNVENLLITTEASLLSVELTSKSIQSNWSQSINNDVRSSPSPSTAFSSSTNDYTVSGNSPGEFPKLPNEPVNNGINHLLSPITKEKDEWLERILIKENSSQDEPHRIETRLEIPKDSSKPMKKIVKIWYKRGRIFLSNPSTSNIKLNLTNSNEESDKFPRTKIIRIPRGHRPERMGYRKGVFLNKIPIITTTAATTSPANSDSSTSTTLVSISATDVTTTIPVSTQASEESTTLLSAILTEKASSESPTQSTTDEPSTISTLQPTTIISSTPSPSTSTSAITTVITTEGTESPEIINSTQRQPSPSPSSPTTMKTISFNNPFLLSTITTTSSPSTTYPTTFSSIMTTKDSNLTTPILPIQSTPSPTSTLASTIITSTESATTVSLSTSDNNPIKPSALYVPPIASLLRSLVGNQALISKGIGLNSPLGLTSTPRKNRLSSNLYIPPIPAGGDSETSFEVLPSSPSLQYNNENKFHYNKHLISSNHNSPITRSVGIINMEKQPYHLPLAYFH